ncbi:uncharacterized protein LOC118202487 isoform X3 [Stegodyphus dumicola]|uniref:uncharacterized protein LOC118202487 isoform X3 n=1 Tax=Stegodyphus dumicola TaxID=202533 RepID=UPI0015A80869|nr:uncharacterized protein LOC118202487 isoform X3 [Stegodyphus dumicola]
MYNRIANSALNLTVFILFFLLPLSSFGKPNTPSIKMACDISGVHLLFSFKSDFTGMLYAKDYHSSKMCSVRIFEKSPVRTVSLDLPISECGSQIFGESGTYNIANTIVVDDVNSSYVLERRILCQLSNLTESYLSAPKQGRNKNITLRFTLILSMELDVDLLPQNSNDDLALMVYFDDKEEDKDMMVKNCFIHNEDATYRLSDANNCPHSDDIFYFRNLPHSRKSHFVVVSAIKPFVLPLKLRRNLTCGVLVCNGICPNICNNATEENKDISKYSDKNIRSLDESQINVSDTDSFGLTDMVIIPTAQEPSFPLSLTSPRIKKRDDQYYDSSGKFEIFSCNLTARLSPSLKSLKSIFYKIKKTPLISITNSSSKTNCSSDSFPVKIFAAINIVLIIFVIVLCAFVLTSIQRRKGKYYYRENIPLIRFDPEDHFD